MTVLKETHDNERHWMKVVTFTKLWEFIYWPNQTTDVKKYIKGCILCLQHTPATCSQPLQFITVNYPFQLISMNFIDLFFETPKGNRFIFHYVCYFSRYSISFAIKNDNVEDVYKCLKKVFICYQRLITVYCDWRHHFDNQILRNWLLRRRININYNLSWFHKFTGMIEMHNKLLKIVVWKNFKDFDLTLSSATQIVNNWIISHLSMSLFDILLSSKSLTLLTPVKKLGMKTQTPKYQDIETFHNLKVHDAVIKIWMI